MSSQGVMYGTPLIGTTEQDGSKSSPERAWASQLSIANSSALRWQQAVVGTVLEAHGAPAQPSADPAQALHGLTEPEPEVIDSTVYIYM